MRNKARDYTPTTVKKLFMLSCNECAAPNCNNKLLARDGDTIIAKICHIEAANPDGPRYNPNMTDDERRHYDNLIILCDECHQIIDNKNNEHIYTVELLREWKRNHEINCTNKTLKNKPTLLNIAINAISNLDLDEAQEDVKELKTYKVGEKISYNSVKKWKPNIEEYKIYYGKINNLYDELENQGKSFKKDKLLRVIRTVYLKVKGKYISNNWNNQTDDMAIIRQNADNIFDDVENELLNRIDKNQSADDDIFIALPIILVDAFIKCKILEEPK